MTTKNYSKILFCCDFMQEDSAAFKAYARLKSAFSQHQTECKYIKLTQSTPLPINPKSLIEARSKDSLIICANIWQVILAYTLTIGAKANICFWIQGLVAEESFLRNKSKSRFATLLIIEKICFSMSSSYIFVSPYMREFYEKRFRKDLKAKSIEIPCISDLRAKNTPRIKNSYCYLGGMSPWQKFDVVIRIMNTIISRQPDATLSVATKDTTLCKKIIDSNASEELKHALSVVSLEKKEDIESFLSEMQFGFLIRDDNPINNVASPIKLAEYLSCGVNVITTKAVSSYYKSLDRAGFIVDIDNAQEIDPSLIHHSPCSAINIYKDRFSEESLSIKISSFLAQNRPKI